MAEPANNPEPPRARSTAPAHRRLYRTSVTHTLLFYGTVVTLCAVLNVFMALIVIVFFLRFYRREIRAFLAHPLRTVRPGPRESAYRMEVLPPYSTGREPEA